jgi:hypothetical protein
VKPVVRVRWLDEECKTVDYLARSHSHHANSAGASRRTVGGLKVDGGEI